MVGQFFTGVGMDGAGQGHSAIAALGLLPGATGAGSPGLGIVFKVADGDQRGTVRPAVTLEILRQLGAITPSELQALEKFGPTFPLNNFRKIHVGDARPSFTLHRSG